MKKLVSILCALVMILSLSAAAFADTPNAGFDPAAILCPEPEEEPAAEEESVFLTLDSYMADVDAAVAAIRGGDYLEFTADQGYMRCFVDPEGPRTNGILPIVRIDVYPEEDVTDFIKSYYYLNLDGASTLVCAHYRTNHYINGDQNYFYFGVDSTDGANKLMALKFRPYGEDHFNVITPNDFGYEEIAKEVVAESDALLQDAQTRLTALSNMGLY